MSQESSVSLADLCLPNPCFLIPNSEVMTLPFIFKVLKDLDPQEELVLDRNYMATSQEFELQ